MRISIQGENDAAAELKGLLRHEGYLVTDLIPTHAITLEEDPALQDHFLIDGIDCPLEKRISEHVHQLTGKNFYFSRIGGIRSDSELRIRFAPADSHEVAVGVFRGLLDVLAPRRLASPVPNARWRRLRKLWSTFTKA